MSFPLYRVLFFVLLGLGMAALGVLLVCLLVSPTMPRLAAKIFFSSAIFLIGASSLLNVGCGLQHRKMWGKGGLRIYEREEKTCFAIDLTVFAALGIFSLVLSFKTWMLPS